MERDPAELLPIMPPRLARLAVATSGPNWRPRGASVGAVQPAAGEVEADLALDVPAQVLGQGGALEFGEVDSLNGLRHRPVPTISCRSVLFQVRKQPLVAIVLSGSQKPYQAVMD